LSYCRCTEEGSDVYVYANAVLGGWTIQIAYDVGLSKDGQSYLAKTPEDAIDYLKGITILGYGVPDKVFDRLDKDIKEIQNDR